MNSPTPFADDWHLINAYTGEKLVSESAAPKAATASPILAVGTGWVNDPTAVTIVMDEWRAAGLRPMFQDAAPGLMVGAENDEEPVFFWDAERVVLNRQLVSWDQRQVGACVGFGFGREAQDLLLWEIASGEPESWPGAQLAPEVIYGGSRVEVGGGRIRGDGSVGAWAAKFLMGWGVVVRGMYGALDLTQYSEANARRLGEVGLTSDMEALARVHPVRAAAMVTTAQEGWAAIGGGKPIAVCSDVGFTTRLDRDGFCVPSGVWNHCMGARGRFVHPRRGRSIPIGNSWANYMGTPAEGFPVEYVKKDGSIGTFQLPPGHFCATLDVFGRMLAQRDSYALAGMTGWAKTTVDYTP